MRVIGVSEILGRTQEFFGSNPRWRDALAEERKGAVILYQWVVPATAAEWQGYYLPLARISPVNDTRSLFVLSYYNNRRWQDLEVAGHLEECLQAVRDNVGGVFLS